MTNLPKSELSRKNGTWGDHTLVGLKSQMLINEQYKKACFETNLIRKDLGIKRFIVMGTSLVIVIS
ncbi:hypothetical protein [Brevibacillus laterosporus]|uniref:hypothetical protein n=1 Tax=Brevibacillus laterosporus TaxID=1465 RepID=UPI001A7E8026|nr:hypothetical protein [Brevibacillus laterosporus]